MLGSTNYYKRNLPHWQPAGAIFFITFRTAGSLPVAVANKLKADAKAFQNTYRHLPSDAPELVLCWKKLFKYADEALDKSQGAAYFRNPAAAAIVKQSIMKGQALQHYILHRYCIMPNHVHLIIEPLPLNLLAPLTPLPQPQWPPLFYREAGRALLCKQADADGLVWHPLGKILKALKGATARRLSQALNIPAPIWMQESFDHWLRNGEEYTRLLAYVDNNPVKAGLASLPSDWRWGSAADDSHLGDS